MYQAELLRGQTILITGGGTGLGRSMALRFAELGANLFLAARREEPLRDTAEEKVGSQSTCTTTPRCHRQRSRVREEKQAGSWPGQGSRCSGLNARWGKDWRTHPARNQCGGTKSGCGFFPAQTKP